MHGGKQEKKPEKEIKPLKPCPQCGAQLDRRSKTEQIVVMVDSSHGLSRDIEITQEYCTRCHLVVKDDLYGARERARSEMSGGE